MNESGKCYYLCINMLVNKQNVVPPLYTIIMKWPITRLTCFIYFFKRLSLDGSSVFGLYPVVMALQANKRTFHNLYIKESLQSSTNPLVLDILNMCQERGVNVKPCHKLSLNRFSENRPHQVRLVIYTGLPTTDKCEIVLSMHGFCPIVHGIFTEFKKIVDQLHSIHMPCTHFRVWYWMPQI